MTREELEDMGISIEGLEGGYIIADYSCERESKHGVLFAGRSMIWKSVPNLKDLFDNENEAIENAVIFFEVR